MQEKEDLQERLHKAEMEGISKDADIERLEYWLEERVTTTEQASQQQFDELQEKYDVLKGLYEKSLRSTSECARLEKEKQVLVTRLAEVEAEVGKCWQKITEKDEEIDRLEGYNANVASAEYDYLDMEYEDLKAKYEKLEQRMEGESDTGSGSPSTMKKRLPKAAKKNKNLLAKKEELEKQVDCLELQIKGLKDLKEHREPLVKVGAAIRMLLEKANRLGVSGRLDRWVIEAGNNAAHAENGFADWAVFHTGYGTLAEFGDVFHAIYGVDYDKYDASRYCLCKPCQLEAEVNRFYASEETEVYREIVSKLHDEIHALNGGTHNDCMTVEGDSKAAVLINRLEAVSNEILATDVRGHERTPKGWVPPEERDYQVSYCTWPYKRILTHGKSYLYHPYD